MPCMTTDGAQSPRLWTTHMHIQCVRLKTDVNISTKHTNAHRLIHVHVGIHIKGSNTHGRFIMEECLLSALTHGTGLKRFQTKVTGKSQSSYISVKM